MAESKVKRENFITVQGWMLTDLKLKGNELIIYACIYGFSQAENQVFNGSLQYLADWTNSTKRSVMNCLKSLEEKGFIVKKENYINGVKFCEYYATKFTGGMEKSSLGDETKFTGGMEQSSPNNISYNPDNKIEKKDRVIGTTRTTFSKPSIEEIRAYCKERQNGIDAERFFDYYEAIGWKVGKNTMKDWKACVRTWEKNQKQDEKPKEEPAKPIKRTIYDII